jgi:hypothetical protein
MSADYKENIFAEYFRQINDGFFELIKEHCYTIKGLLNMREKLLGGR